MRDIDCWGSCKNKGGGNVSKEIRGCGVDDVGVGRGDACIEYSRRTGDGMLRATTQY